MPTAWWSKQRDTIILNDDPSFSFQIVAGRKCWYRYLRKVKQYFSNHFSVPWTKLVRHHFSKSHFESIIKMQPPPRKVRIRSVFSEYRPCHENVLLVFNLANCFFLICLVFWETELDFFKYPNNHFGFGRILFPLLDEYFEVLLINIFVITRIFIGRFSQISENFARRTNSQTSSEKSNGMRIIGGLEVIYSFIYLLTFVTIFI